MSQIVFMLDTDTLSYIVKGRPPEVRSTFLERDPTTIAISSIVRYEVLAGLKDLGPFHPLQTRASSILAHMTVLAWDADAADICAEIRHRMRVGGTTLAEMDTLIAAHAISLGATLVTNNVRHFGRLQPELSIENWVTVD